jgi:putative Holliday junction resolvase
MVAEPSAARSDYEAIMAVAAIDFGFKRLGVAVSDAAGIGVYPLTTISRTSFKADLNRLRDLLGPRQITKLVIGLPLSMDGTGSSLTRAACGFAERLKRELTFEIEMFDERLTSFEARERINAADLSRTRRSRQIDARAAAVILETYLAATNRKNDRAG